MIKRTIAMLICGMVLFSQPVLAMDGSGNNISYYKYQLDEMANNDSFDFVGKEGEELYFDLRDEYARGNPFKQIGFDAMTLGNQYKLTAKAYRQNDILYDIFFVAGGVRYAVKSGKMAWKRTPYLGKTLNGLKGAFRTIKKY